MKDTYTKNELEIKVKETYGHIIVSWTPEMQIAYPDLVFLAIDIDDANLKRIHKEFYKVYADEILERVNYNNYYNLPKIAFDADPAFVKFYLYLDLQKQIEINDEVLIEHLDVLKDTVKEYPEIVKLLSTEVQEYLIEEIKVLVINDSTYLEHISDELFERHIDLVEYILENKPELYFCLPISIHLKYEYLLTYLTKDILDDIAINGMEDEDENRYYPRVNDMKILAKLLNISSYAILLASDKILRKMKSKNLKRRLQDKTLRLYFIERFKLISKFKKIRP